MSGREKILFLVEGAVLEPKIIQRMAKVYGVSCEITVFGTNIYELYRQLKQDDGFTDLVGVLKERATGDADLEKLNQKYASIYLVFDAEIQDSAPRDEDVLCCAKKTCAKLKEMLEFFNDEFDHGKLYINYPMVESYRDCAGYFDEGYQNRIIALDELFRRNGAPGYKALVGQRGLNLRPEKLSREEFGQLSRMNVYKLNCLATQNWATMNYDRFRELSEQSRILQAEQNFMEQQQAVSVLNTLLFFMLDYLGKTLYETAVQ